MWICLGHTLKKNVFSLAHFRWQTSNFDCHPDREDTASIVQPQPVSYESKTMANIPILTWVLSVTTGFLLLTVAVLTILIINQRQSFAKHHRAVITPRRHQNNGKFYARNEVMTNEEFAEILEIPRTEDNAADIMASVRRSAYPSQPSGCQSRQMCLVNKTQTQSKLRLAGVTPECFTIDASCPITQLNNNLELEVVPYIEDILHTRNESSN